MHGGMGRGVSMTEGKQDDQRQSKMSVLKHLYLTRSQGEDGLRQEGLMEVTGNRKWAQRQAGKD